MPNLSLNLLNLNPKWPAQTLFLPVMEFWLKFFSSADIFQGCVLSSGIDSDVCVSIICVATASVSVKELCASLKCNKHLIIHYGIQADSPNKRECVCAPSVWVHKGSSMWCFTTQIKNCKCFKQETFGGCATGGRYLTNLRCGPPSRRKLVCGQRWRST